MGTFTSASYHALLYVFALIRCTAVRCTLRLISYLARSPQSLNYASNTAHGTRFVIMFLSSALVLIVTRYYVIINSNSVNWWQLSSSVCVSVTITGKGNCLMPASCVCLHLRVMSFTYGVPHTNAHTTRWCQSWSYSHYIYSGDVDDDATIK